MVSSPKLSVIIITKDEEKNIGDCLKSVDGPMRSLFWIPVAVIELSKFLNDIPRRFMKQTGPVLVFRKPGSR